VVTQPELALLVAEAKGNGQGVVFTNGCFDLLHPGHIRGLEAARALGDLLIVAINSDSSVRFLKGHDRPVMPQEERAEILAALAAVDYVVIFDELSPRALIAEILPHMLVKGGDWGAGEIEGRSEVEAAGGRVVSIPIFGDYSTSAIIERIRSASSPPADSASAGRPLPGGGAQ
jgi:D-beta-D-heptose 7-phosphate kinase/D-beta-D-heptose 1-phosphate adenosyltransferase